MVNGRAGARRIFNHQWDDPSTFVELGTLPAEAVEQATGGLLSRSVTVALNRLAVEHDHVLICGPVFPHEVAGFSGGTKYLFPGIAAPEIIHFTHWLGALITSSVVIGTIDTPVRAIIDRAAALLETPLSLLALVVTHDGTAGVFCGDPHAAWRGAASLSSQRHVIWVDEPYDRVLAVMPKMYDDIWTAAKGAYKTEPVVSDGGEIIIYAPHVTRSQLRPRQADRGDRLSLPRLFSLAVGSLRGISRRDPRAFDARQGVGHLRGREARRSRESRSRSRPASRASGASGSTWATGIRPASIRASGPRTETRGRWSCRRRVSSSIGSSRPRELPRPLAIAFEQPHRDRPRLAGADRPVVDARHRAQLARRARDEGFVGALEVLREERLVADLDADVLSRRRTGTTA